MGYKANGIIHVHVQACGIKAVTFIPDKYVEQDGNKFVAFAPGKKQAQGGKPVEGIFVRVAGGEDANGVEGVLLKVADFSGKDLLLMAAVKGIKVTVTVSRDLELNEIVVPAVSAKSSG